MRIDLLHLFRTLRRSPASAIAAVLTLSLTLGAGASIFAVVDAVLLTPPPFTNPETLAVLGETPIDAPAAAPRVVTYATFEAWRERAGSLAVLEAFDGTNLTLTDLGEAERVSVNDVTPGLLPLLGVAPALGRSFDINEIGQPVIMIGHAFWRTKFGADPQVLGRQVNLGGRPHTIVGVLPERFAFALSQSDLWRALPVVPGQPSRVGYRVAVVARLAANVSSDHLETVLNDVSRMASPPAGVVATSISTVIARDAKTTVRLLAGAAGLAVLIAFTNLAGLLMVRSIDRRRELAVRTALGARRSEIARQLLLEAQALVLLGTVGGVILALWLTPLAGRLALEQLGAVANRDVAVSWRVIGVVSILASACAWLAGLVPVVMTNRRNVVDVLRRGATTAPRELRLRRLLVTGEVALAFLLLVCMTLLGGSLIRVLRLNPGFDGQGVLALQVSLPTANYASPDRIVSFYTTLQSALTERLGDRAISFVNEIPLTGDGGRRLVAAGSRQAGVEAVQREIGPAYFNVMRIPIVAGRSFDTADNSSAPVRAVVSSSLAERLFGSDSPIGRQLRWGTNGQAAEIVGVAGDVKHRALDEATVPTVYLSAAQIPSPSSIIVVRSGRLDADVIAAVREEVARLDNNLPVYRTRSMRDVINASPGVPARRVLTATFSAFAVLAVVLGAIGLFGVVAHDVARRRAELALRMALGADPMRILRNTLRQGALMVAGGLVAGAVLSYWATRALSTMLLPPDRLDVLSVGAAGVVLIVAGVGAVLPAAVRAARTDPVMALRAE